jgi:hypothetical protein
MLYPQSPPGNVNNFPAQITLPDDGTDLEAADVNVALEALADRTAYLKKRLGGWRPVGFNSFVNADSGETYAEYCHYTSSLYNDGNNPVTVSQTCEPLDVLDISAEFMVTKAGTDVGAIRLVTTTDGGSAVELPGARSQILAQDTRFRLSLSGLWVAAAGIVVVKVQAKSTLANAIRLIGPGVLYVRQYRSN